MQSAVSVLLGHNVGEVTFGLVTTVLTGKPALNARQMLLVNMLTDALPAAALAVSPQRDPDVTRPARRVDDLACGGGAGGVHLARRAAGVDVRPIHRNRIAGGDDRPDRAGGDADDQDADRLARTAGGGDECGYPRGDGLIISTPGVSQMFGCTLSGLSAGDRHSRRPVSPRACPN